MKELYGHWKHLSSLAAGDRRMQQTDNFEADGTQIDILSAQGSNWDMPLANYLSSNFMHTDILQFLDPYAWKFPLTLQKREQCRFIFQIASNRIESFIQIMEGDR